MLAKRSLPLGGGAIRVAAAAVVIAQRYTDYVLPAEAIEPIARSAGLAALRTLVSTPLESDLDPVQA